MILNFVNKYSISKTFFDILQKFVILLLISNPVFASTISLGTVVVDFNSEKKRNYIDVPVFNGSDKEKAYVKVEVYEILNPGTKNEKKILVTKGSDNPLIVSPQKFVIPASGKKNIRFIALRKNNDKDRIYRVNVAPVVGKFEATNGQHIKILIAYDVLTFIRPNDENSNFEVKREGKKITFSNLGNTNILFRKGKQCAKDKIFECKNIPGKRLYAGGKFTQNLPYDNEVEYLYSIGDKIHNKVY